MMMCHMSDSDSDEVEVILYSSVCEVVYSYLETIKIPDDLKNEALWIRCVVQPLVKEEDDKEIKGVFNAASVFNPVNHRWYGKRAA